MGSEMCISDSSERLVSARVSLGAVSPLPIRAGAAEIALVGVELTDEAIRTAAEKTIQGALPLSGNSHKCNLIVNLTERAIQNSLAQRS